MKVRELVAQLSGHPDQDAQVVVMAFDHESREWDLREIDGDDDVRPMFIRPYTKGGLLEWCEERAKGAVKAVGVWVR